jgi:hypothetical protein
MHLIKNKKYYEIKLFNSIYLLIFLINLNFLNNSRKNFCFKIFFTKTSMQLKTFFFLLKFLYSEFSYIIIYIIY